MSTTPETIQKINDQIKRSDEAICRQINHLDILGRGAVSQDILINLRTFVEHVMFKVYAHTNTTIYDYDNIETAIKFIKSKGQLKFLWKFHHYLQIVASHYTLDPEDSERVMLKYYEYMLKIKDFLKTRYNFEVFKNIDEFPLNTDRNLQEYYEKIAEKLENRNPKKDEGFVENARYYIYKIKPFFVNQKIYYEITFYPTMERIDKFGRIIAFTTLDISKYYAVKLWTIEDSIQITDQTMPIFIIINWEVAIRPIEIERFSNIFGKKLKNYAVSAEGRGLMKFLTVTGFNLVELICLEEEYYQNIRNSILSKYNAKVSHLFDIFDTCRDIIMKNRPGSNILRYLLYHLNNRIITDQIDDENNLLSGLYLHNGCIPFEKMPFCTSLKGHNPRLVDLFDCIESQDRMHEIFARYVRMNTEKRGQLYTPNLELERFGEINTLVNTFNGKLYRSAHHQERRLEERSQHYYIRGCENDTIQIIQNLEELSCCGLENYTSYVDGWLTKEVHKVDCEEKREALRHMFAQSTIALIYGSAGTGKSTLIDHISDLFKSSSRLYLANTNPAVENLRRRVTVHSEETDFMTVAKFIKNQGVRTKYGILVIDECSITVSDTKTQQTLAKPVK